MWNQQNSHLRIHVQSFFDESHPQKVDSEWGNCWVSGKIRDLHHGIHRYNLPLLAVRHKAIRHRNCLQNEVLVE